MTAVEFIEDYLKFKGIIIDDKTFPQVLVGVINQAKEMEKQQIIDARVKKHFEWYLEAEKYYNETFKK
jgi:hypothetical protein